MGAWGFLAQVPLPCSHALIRVGEGLCFGGIPAERHGFEIAACAVVTTPLGVTRGIARRRELLDADVPFESAE